MKLKKYSFLFLLFLTLHVFGQAALIPERPSPNRLVNNLSSSGILTNNEEEQLERKLETFANQTSNQIVIVIVDDLQGMEPFQYATELGQKWGVGQKDQDNGIVILLKPLGGPGVRQLFIAPGYGLQGAIPDLATKQIRENEMYPYFKENKFYEGLDKGTDALMSLAKGEYNSDQYAPKKKGGFKLWKLILLIIVIVFYILRNNRRGGGGGLSMGTGFLLSSLLNSGGGFGGSSSSSDSGGFGGFGGGSFGGGGSGGSW